MLVEIPLDPRKPRPIKQWEIHCHYFLFAFQINWKHLGRHRLSFQSIKQSQIGSDLENEPFQQEIVEIEGKIIQY